MQGNSPLTDAVYGKRSTARKPPRPVQRRRADFLVGTSLGEELVAELYKQLGFKRPDQRRKRGQQ